MTPDKAKNLANDIDCVLVTLRAISDELKTSYPAADYRDDPPWTETEQPASKPKPKPVTLEEVRAVLSEKSANGKRNEVKALLVKHGAAQLSVIPPENYAALLADAEGL